MVEKNFLVIKRNRHSGSDSWVSNFAYPLIQFKSKIINPVLNSTGLDVIRTEIRSHLIAFNYCDPNIIAEFVLHYLDVDRIE